MFFGGRWESMDSNNSFMFSTRVAAEDGGFMFVSVLRCIFTEQGAFLC